MLRGAICSFDALTNNILNWNNDVFNISIMTEHDKIQEEIVKKALEFFKTEQRGYIDGAMRLGKIKISIEIMKRMFSRIPIVLIAYPDNKIEDSWKQELTKWAYSNTWITFVNFRSLHKYKDEIFDFFIIDEFHDCSDNERDYCHQIMTKNKEIKTLALSGTISKETKGLWGLREIAKYTTNEGIQAGILADYRINVHFVDLDKKIKTPNKKGKLLSEKQKYDNYTYVINTFRNEGKDTMHLTLSRNRLSTSSIGKMNYLKSLLKKLKDKRVIVFCGLTDVADKTYIPSYHNKSENDDNFQKFQRGEINHLALANMGKMGVSYKDLDCVILLNATGNKEETAQVCNRAIKLDYKGKVADIHIIALNEQVEISKIKNTLSMLDKNKIKYI